MELNTSEQYLTLGNVLQEEETRILAKSYMTYKIGEFRKLAAKTKIIYIKLNDSKFIQAILIYDHHFHRDALY